MFYRATLKASSQAICLLIAVIFGSCTLTPAKCISLQISMEGVIDPPTDGLAIRVEAVSATKGHPVTHVSQESAVTAAHFRVTAWFNTTSNVIRSETCDGQPRLVTLKLMNRTTLLDRQELKIEADFRQTNDGDYELLKPVILRATAKP